MDSKTKKALLHCLHQTHQSIQTCFHSKNIKTIPILKKTQTPYLSIKEASISLVFAYIWHWKLYNPLIIKSEQLLKHIITNLELEIPPSIEPKLLSTLTFFYVELESLLNPSGTKKTNRLDNEEILSLYDSYLARYWPEQKSQLGIYSTPNQVSRFIGEGIDYLLKNELKLSGGLLNINDKPSNPNGEYHLIDPSMGTGVFLQSLIDLLYDRIQVEYEGEAEKIKLYAFRSCLERLSDIFLAFEIDYSSYILSKLFLSCKMQSIYNHSEPCDFGLKVVLDSFIDKQPMLRNLTKDNDDLIYIFLGNPPYLALSNHNKPWIKKLLKGELSNSINIPSYYHIGGEPLKEKKIWVSDDYIKFIAVCQWIIQQRSKGILAFITNNGFLHHPTLRGMRYSLLKTFDTLYILNLNGSMRTGLKNSGNALDENIFPIQQGITLFFFIKKSNQNTQMGRVLYQEIWGSKQVKLDYLLHHHFKNIDWKPVQLYHPQYSFTPQAEADIKNYNTSTFSLSLGKAKDTSFPLTSIFKEYSNGIITSRDHFALAFTKQELQRRIEDFINPIISHRTLRQKYGLKDNYQYKLEIAREKLSGLLNKKVEEGYIQRIAYRPMDYRYVYYHPSIVWRPRWKVMQHLMLINNIALISTRQHSQSFLKENLLAVTQYPIESSFISNKTRETNYIFPLYLIPKIQRITDPFDHNPFYLQDSKHWTKEINLDEDFINQVAQQLKIPYKQGLNKHTTSIVFDEQDLFNYILGIVYLTSKASIQTHRNEFISIPIPNTLKQFWEMVKTGDRVARWFLDLESIFTKDTKPYPINFAQGQIHFCGKNPIMVHPKYPVYKNKQIYLNPSQYFYPVSQEMWDLKIGRFRVCEKWLKDKRKRELTTFEIEQYQHMLWYFHELNI